MTRIDELPDDPALLKRLLVEQREQLRAEHDALVERVRQEAADQLEAQRLRLEAEKKAEIDAILRRFYGPKSERFDPRQLLLFGIQVDTMPLDEPSVEEEAGEQLVTRRVRNRDKHGRRQLPDHLPRVDIEHDLADAEKPCPCCGEVRQRIGREVSEQLEYLPASFKVLRHVRHTYACKRCETTAVDPQIETAAKPTRPIDRGLAGPGLLAYVITSKLGDHLPLYRLEHIFERSGVSIARSTMCAWLQAAGELVQPLVGLMTDRVRQSRVIHADETVVPVQAPGTGRCRKGRIWTYIGDPANPYIVYHYTPDRTRAGPSGWLADYQGYLQADAYGGYDGIYHKGGVTEVACWAHARRKFFDAQSTDGKRSAAMLAMVGELYDVERRAKDLSEEACLELRQCESVPILDVIKTWLDDEVSVVLPRSAMAGAIGYALNQWDALRVYATQGFLSIDNNAAERALKRVAIGRKNWLFAGNDKAGQTAATLYSLIAGAERHGVDPQRYLTSVLAKIGRTPAKEMGQFLPDVWKAEDAAEPMPS
ncbi:MAG: IS66 family transposase [Isosphaeraceae bacterium]|nr:IS66 family transposase [Isosphaeraceae bacterium]